MVLLLKLSRRGHLKEKFQRFAQAVMRFFDRGALAGNIYFCAKRRLSVALAINDYAKFIFYSVLPTKVQFVRKRTPEHPRAAKHAQM